MSGPPIGPGPGLSISREGAGFHLWGPGFSDAVGTGSISPVTASGRGARGHAGPSLWKNMLFNLASRAVPGCPQVSRGQALGKFPSTTHFAGEQALGQKQGRAGPQGRSAGHRWRQVNDEGVTCGSHGALLDASHVARQKLMAEVRKRHVQKHLKQIFSSVTGGPAGKAQPCSYQLRRQT